MSLSWFFRKKNILLNEVTCSLENQENKVVCSTWIMDLMGLIQTTIAEEEEFSMHLHLFLDIFILSVNIFSGYKVFATNFDFEQLRFVFPLALCSVVKTTYFNHRVLEVNFNYPFCVDEDCFSDLGVVASHSSIGVSTNGISSNGIRRFGTFAQ